MACCVGNVVSRCFKKFKTSKAEMREILTASSAAGVAVAFGSPIGGVLFALEEMSTHFPNRTMWKSFFCAMIATIVLQVCASVLVVTIQWLMIVVVVAVGYESIQNGQTSHVSSELWQRVAFLWVSICAGNWTIWCKYVRLLRDTAANIDESLGLIRCTGHQVQSDCSSIQKECVEELSHRRGCRARIYNSYPCLSQRLFEDWYDRDYGNFVSRMWRCRNWKLLWFVRVSSRGKRRLFSVLSQKLLQQKRNWSHGIVAVCRHYFALLWHHHDLRCSRSLWYFCSFHGHWCNFWKNDWSASEILARVGCLLCTQWAVIYSVAMYVDLIQNSFYLHPADLICP